MEINLRGTYIVLDSNEDLLTLVKMLHSLDKNESTKLSSKEIYVKQTDVYKSSLRSSTKSDKLVPNDSEVGVPTDDKVEAESKPARPIWKVFSQDDPSSNDDSDHDSTPNYASDTSVLDIQTDSEDDANDSDVNVIYNANASIFDMQFNDLETLIAEIWEELDADDFDVTGTIDQNSTPEVNNLIHEELFDAAAQNPLVMPMPGVKIAFLDNNVAPPSIVEATIILYQGWLELRECSPCCCSMKGGQEGEERKGAAPVPLIDDSNYSDASDNINETLMKPLLPEAVVVWSFTLLCCCGELVPLDTARQGGA